jgi:hypothetical protein
MAASDNEFVRGLRAAAQIADKFGKQNDNCALCAEDIANEIRRRASLTILRKRRDAADRKPKPKAETPAT